MLISHPICELPYDGLLRSDGQDLLLDPPHVSSKARHLLLAHPLNLLEPEDFFLELLNALLGGRLAHAVAQPERTEDE
jgi:hypothetical protein